MPILSVYFVHFYAVLFSFYFFLFILFLFFDTGLLARKGFCRLVLSLFCCVLSCVLSFTSGAWLGVLYVIVTIPCLSTLCFIILLGHVDMPIIHDRLTRISTNMCSTGNFVNFAAK